MRVFPTQTQDQEFVSLADAGHTGTLNDRQFTYLGAQGYTGTLADRFYQLFISGGSPPALGAITVDSASLRFPDGNMTATNVGAPTYLADAAIWAPTGNRIFTPGTDAMFACLIEVPWEAITMNSSQFMGIVGNRGVSNNAQTLAIWAARGATDQETMSIQFRLIDNGGISLTGGITVTRDQKRLLCVIRMVGSQIVYSVYHNGVLVGDVSPTMSTFAAMQLRSQLCYGAMGSGTTNGFASSGLWYGFIGSIAWVGYYTGAVPAGNLAALSLGADPVVELTAASWRVLKKLVDTGATSLAAASGATGDTTGSLVVLNTRSLTFRKGSDLAPSRSGANYIFADHILGGRVFARLSGESTGRVFLSGVSSGLSGGVQARVFDADTGQLRIDWTTVTGATLGGAWSGYVDSPPNNGWGHIDIRPTDTPALVQRIRSRTGVGLVVGFMGQSQEYRTWQYPATGTVNSDAVPLSTLHIPTRSATTYGFQMHAITSERYISGSLAEASNQLTRWGITEPVMIINMANPGDGTNELQDDALTSWNWSEFEASLETAVGPLSNRRISTIAINWLTNFANRVALAGNGIIGNNIKPLIFGTFDPGATTYTVNHYLRDNLSVPASTLLALSPPMRYGSDALGPFDNGDSEVAAGNHGTGRAQWASYQSANPSVLVGSGPHQVDVEIEAAGGPHSPLTGDSGHPRIMRRTLETALRAMGLITRTDPSLGSASINGGRTAITITPTLPNGGSLQTAWANKSVGVPGGETTVQGFEIQNGGTGAWTRSGFTAEIVSGQVVLTKTSGAWSAGTNVRYGVGGPLSYGTSTESLLLIHGLLYESGADEGGLGLPLGGNWTATV